ncbi:MAG: hypothetical protein ACK559_02935, partial [bacterium]
IYASYCVTSSGQQLLAFTTSSCGHLSSNMSASTSVSPSSSSSLSTPVAKHSQCGLSAQMITSASQMMGAYFPLSKKLTQSQQAAATAA